ncbi:MAG TPA: LCP family protein, partial [Thermoanaerobaculia bacterium]|nr:LCP family protein [Thermoanaerobaculia bacterium]
ILMFAFMAIVVVIAGIAAYAYFSPKLQSVPNRIEEGFKADRINILLIGVGGDTHPGEGKDLADAIMLVSLKPSTKRVALMSLPRDLYVPMGEHGMHRLNAAHKFGGPAYLMEVVGKSVGEPVHAYARIDFRAFREVIDSLGGVDIYVYRPFYDFLFKDGFEQGWQHMNGQRALRYARYRYIRASAEGNVFGRDLRQQQVIEAIKDKVQKLPPQQVLKLVGVARAVGNHTDTNLTATQIADLYSIFRNTGRNDIRNVSLKKYMEVFMIRVPGDTGEAVRPTNNDFRTLHQLTDQVFDGRAPIVARDEIQMTDVAAGASVAKQ